MEQAFVEVKLYIFSQEVFILNNNRVTNYSGYWFSWFSYFFLKYDSVLSSE